jgi:hypothetical protein
MRVHLTEFCVRFLVRIMVDMSLRMLIKESDAR